MAGLIVTSDETWRGEVAICGALCIDRHDFQDFVKEKNLRLEAILADPQQKLRLADKYAGILATKKGPHSKQKANVHIQQLARQLTETLADPEAPAHIKEDAQKSFDRLLPSVKDKNGRVRYYEFNVEQLWNLHDAMQRPDPADLLPQPRNPATGKLMGWTREILGSSDRYLPRSWADDDWKGTENFGPDTF